MRVSISRAIHHEDPSLITVQLHLQTTRSSIILNCRTDDWIRTRKNAKKKDCICGEYIINTRCSKHPRKKLSIKCGWPQRDKSKPDVYCKPEPVPNYMIREFHIDDDCPNCAEESGPARPDLRPWRPNVLKPRDPGRGDALPPKGRGRAAPRRRAAEPGRGAL